MSMPGRSYNNGSSYRYGFNGKENDNEVKGEGNQQDYGMRIYDARLRRFLSVDPLQKDYPELTTYQFASNSPISGIDLDGLEHEYYTLSWADKTGKATLTKTSSVEKTSFLGFEWKLPHVVYVNYPGGSNYNHDFKSTGVDIDNLFKWADNPQQYKRPNGDVMAFEAVFSSGAAKLMGNINMALSNASAMVTSTPRNAPSTKTTTTTENTIKQTSAANGGNVEVSPSSNNSLVATFKYENIEYPIKATVPYIRPKNATTVAQRQAVNQPGSVCVTCQTSQGPFNADHKTPLAVEFLSKGTIDKTKMRSVEAVQSQCQTCSNSQGGQLRQITKKAAEVIKKSSNGTEP